MATQHRVLTIRRASLGRLTTPFGPPPRPRPLLSPIAIVQFTATLVGGTLALPLNEDCARL